jgi:hypothetical protein
MILRTLTSAASARKLGVSSIKNASVQMRMEGTVTKQTNDLRTRARALYQPPFRYEHGYILDKNGEMVVDDHIDAVCRLRGWGRISYVENSEALHDEVGKLVAEILTKYWCVEE